MKRKRNLQEKPECQTFSYLLSPKSQDPFKFEGTLLFHETFLEHGGMKWVQVIKCKGAGIALHIVYPTELKFYDSFEDMKAKQLDKRGRFGQDIWSRIVCADLQNVKADVLKLGIADQAFFGRLVVMFGRLNEACGKNDKYWRSQR